MSGMMFQRVELARALRSGTRRFGFAKGAIVPYDVFIECEKRPQVTVEADRVEEESGHVNFYKDGELVASFKETKVFGYVKMLVPT
jgi:hypothetical protein